MSEAITDVFSICTLRGLDWSSMAGYRDLIGLAQRLYCISNLSSKSARFILDAAISTETWDDAAPLSQWRSEPILQNAFDQAVVVFQKALERESADYARSVEDFRQDKESRFRNRLDQLADLNLELQQGRSGDNWPPREMLFKQLTSWFELANDIWPPQPDHAEHSVRFLGNDPEDIVRHYFPPGYPGKFTHSERLKIARKGLSKIQTGYREMLELVREADARLRALRNSIIPYSDTTEVTENAISIEEGTLDRPVPASKPPEAKLDKAEEPTETTPVAFSDLAAPVLPTMVPTLLPIESKAGDGAKPQAETDTDRPSRSPNQPGPDRQNDIMAAIRSGGVPLMRAEIIHVMKLKREGKLGANLAWMVANKILINIPQRGYWPAGEPVPK